MSRSDHEWGGPASLQGRQAVHVSALVGALLEEGAHAGQLPGSVGLDVAIAELGAEALQESDLFVGQLARRFWVCSSRHSSRAVSQIPLGRGRWNLPLNLQNGQSPSGLLPSFEPPPVWTNFKYGVPIQNVAGISITERELAKNLQNLTITR